MFEITFRGETMENLDKEKQRMNNTLSIKNSGNSENFLDIFAKSKSDVETSVKAEADQEQEQDIDFEVEG